MKIRQLFDKDTSTYSYLLWHEKSCEAALIDSVREQVGRDARLVEELGLKLRFIMETHIHADHVTGSDELRALTGAKVLVHKNSGSRCADRLIDDGDEIDLFDQTIRAMYTPGHTDTDISYLIDGAVFTGDTLLIRGTGRTDFQSGDAGTSYDSITGRLFTLPEATVLYPGHDYHGCTESTIGEEKRWNPRIGNGQTRDEYIAVMQALNLPKPRFIDEAVPGNLACGKAA